MRRVLVANSMLAILYANDFTLARRKCEEEIVLRQWHRESDRKKQESRMFAN